MLKTIRCLAWLLGVFSLVGCSSSICNSWRCKAVIGTAEVISAPARWVAYATNDHRRNVKDKENLRRLQAGDPETVVRCVVGGYCLMPSGTDDKTFKATYDRAIDLVISWWGENPQPAQIPILMAAYNKKGRTFLYKPNPSEAEKYFRLAASLAIDPRIVSGLKSPDFWASNWSEGHYTDMAESVQTALMMLHHAGDEGHSDSLDAFQCQAIAAWPPAWMNDAATENKSLINSCETAYNSLFQTIHKRRPANRKTFVVVPGVLDPVVEGPAS